MGVRCDPEDAPKNFHRVATVDVPDADYEYAFELTNNIDHGWWENKLVTPHFEGEGCRSTMVGDRIEFPSKEVWECKASGWEAINKSDEPDAKYLT